MANDRPTRTDEELAEHFTQPADNVVFVRHDLSEEELDIARKRVRDGESVDSVVDDLYDQITARSADTPEDNLFAPSVDEDGHEASDTETK